MDFHPVVLREQRLNARPRHLRIVLTGLSEMTTKEAEFRLRQADRLMRLSDETRDPQLCVQLVIMSKAWTDQSARTRLRFKLLDAWRRYGGQPIPG
jgi:aspartate carbamoyltransferase catalytic subunit